MGSLRKEGKCLLTFRSEKQQSTLSDTRCQPEWWASRPSHPGSSGHTSHGHLTLQPPQAVYFRSESARHSDSVQWHAFKVATVTPQGCISKAYTLKYLAPSCVGL